MTAALAVPCVVYALVLAAAVLVNGLRDRPRPRAVTAGLVVLEVALVVQAGRVVLTGTDSAEPVVHLAYAATSVLLLPIAVGVGDASLWGSVALAIALIAVVVVVMRMQSTGIQVDAG